MEKPPKDKTIGDAAYQISKAIFSSVPVASGPLTALLENIFNSPLDKRKQKWLEELSCVISDLQENIKDFSPEKLSQNEMFITASMHATQIALKNHQKEKLDALKNAVFNSALPNAPDEDKQMMFLRLIDELTPWHIRLLTLLDNPIKGMREKSVGNPGWSMGSVSSLIEYCFPELRENRDFYGLLIRDLQITGLIHQGSFVNTMMTGSGVMASRTENFGKQFINYISRG